MVAENLRAHRWKILDTMLNRLQCLISELADIKSESHCKNKDWRCDALLLGSLIQDLTTCDWYPWTSDIPADLSLAAAAKILSELHITFQCPADLADRHDNCDSAEIESIRDFVCKACTDTVD